MTGVIGAGTGAIGAALSTVGVSEDAVIRYETALKAEKQLLTAHGARGDGETHATMRCLAGDRSEVLLAEGAPV